jgi:hypothetical protein
MTAECARKTDHNDDSSFLFDSVVCKACRDTGQRGWCGRSGRCWAPNYPRAGVDPDFLIALEQTIDICSGSKPL